MEDEECETDEESELMFSFSLEILSAIMFSMVLIHLALIPILDPISRPQKNLASALPMIDFLLVCKVQFKALVLSVTHNNTGYGSSFVVNLAIHELDDRCTVVYNDCYILQTVNRDEFFRLYCFRGAVVTYGSHFLEMLDATKTPV